MWPSEAEQSFLLSGVKENNILNKIMFAASRMLATSALYRNEKSLHSGRRNELWHLFFSQAVERQLFLYSIASVDHLAWV